MQPEAGQRTHHRAVDADELQVTPHGQLEVLLGRDLQFIRINGTVVGGLVGVLIHAATVLAG